MPFPVESADAGGLRPLRKLTLDLDGVQTPLPSSKVFEWQRMTNGRARLLITAPYDTPHLFRELAGRLATPLFLLYVLHTPRGEGAAGRYQSPPLAGADVDDFLADFATYLAGDARHDVWVHSPGDSRTLIWDRHDLLFAEGEPLDEIAATLEEMGFRAGEVPLAAASPHIHYYRAEFDAEAAAVLARFDWTYSGLRPEDEQ